MKLSVIWDTCCPWLISWVEEFNWIKCLKKKRSIQERKEKDNLYEKTTIRTSQKEEKKIKIIQSGRKPKWSE